MRPDLYKIFVLVLALVSSVASAQKYNLLPDTIYLCEGDSASIEIRQDVGVTTEIVWNTPRGTINNTKKIRAFIPGKYYIRLTQNNRSKLNDSSFIRVFSRPEKQLTDTNICRGRSIFLDAGNPGMKYLWSSGQHSQKIRIENPGRYWVRITNGRCATYDTVMVRFHPASSVSLAREAVFCLNDESKVLSAKAAPDVELLWNTGATTPSISVVREGVYYLTSNSKYCGVHTDTIRVRLKACECEMLIPNSFSPNEDNRNDYFFPVVDCEYTYFLITITDRWGYTVFTGNSPGSRWDGRFKGNLCPEDIYIYRIESTEKSADKKQVRTGHISLFR